MNCPYLQWYHVFLEFSKIFISIPWYSSVCSDLPSQTITSWYSTLSHYILRYSSMFIFQCSQGAAKTDHDIMIFDAIPQYSMTFPQRASKTDHDAIILRLFHDIPRYSMIFQYTQGCSKTAYDVIIFHAVPRYSMIVHCIQWHHPWSHHTPLFSLIFRYSVLVI